MKFELLKNCAVASLAVALSVTALPAQAQEEGQWRNRGERAAQHQAQRGSVDAESQRGMRPSWRPAAAAQPAPRVAPAPPAAAAPPAPAQAQAQSAQQGRRGDGGRPQWQRTPQPAQVQAPARAQAPVQAQRNWQRDGQRQDRRDDRRDDRRNDRPETRQDWGQRQDWRDGNRSGTWSQNRDSDRYRDASRYRDGYRDAYRDARRSDYRQWDRRWRDDRRYDWNRYRYANRATFNLGIYYSPYRTYSYRRLGIGTVLQSLFYSNRYWVNDPWQYRLPEVYGPYRWVRYYDDVLLVDVYSGQVVDVIYDFFW